MPQKKYLVTLTPEEREQLTALLTAGKRSALTLTRARILLKADQAPGGLAWADDRIAEALDCGLRTVERVRQRFVERGLEPALGRKPQDRPSRERKLDGRAEARLIALACSAPPQGRSEWTMQLLAEVGRTADRGHGFRRDGAASAQKNEIKPWLKEQWCIPPKGDAEFVAAMEDVLEVYHRPFDSQRPLVCLDEASRQLIGEVVQPIPARPGQPERFDHEYVRNGTANLFMVFEPLLGWRAVQVTQRRTAKDFAEVLRWLVEEVHADAERVVLVVDNLNTHKASSLYEAFPPEQARRIAERIEWHYTPKHGSWLNMAEIELSVLQRQALGQRIESQEQLAGITGTWEEDRNERGVEVKWRFTTADARIKLRKLYPSLQ